MFRKFSKYQIEQPNKNQFVLHIRPLCIDFLIILLIGLLLLLLLTSLYMPYSIDLTCNRNYLNIPSVINCKLIKRDCWGIRKTERIISANSYQSVIEEEYLGNSTKPDYRVMLLADQEKINIARFTRYYHNDLWEKQNKQINDFITSNNLNSLTVGENNLAVLYTFLKLITFILLISLIVWGTKIYLSYTFSKESNSLLIKRYNRLTKIVREIPFNDIEKICLQESDGIDVSTSRIVFQLKSGEKIPVTSWLDSYSGKDKVVKFMNQFLQ